MVEGLLSAPYSSSHPYIFKKKKKSERLEQVFLYQFLSS